LERIARIAVLRVAHASKFFRIHKNVFLNVKLLIRQRELLTK
jgi:hypothetical protein